MPFVEYDEVRAACPECGRLFPTEEALHDHQADSHERAAPAEKRRSASCSICEKKFPTVGQLAEHSRRAHST